MESPPLAINCKQEALTMDYSYHWHFRNGISPQVIREWVQDNSDQSYPPHPTYKWIKGSIRQWFYIIKVNYIWYIFRGNGGPTLMVQDFTGYLFHSFMGFFGLWQRYSTLDKLASKYQISLKAIPWINT